MTMHRYHSYNFRIQLLRQKIVSVCNIAAVCCNSHVQENILSLNRFTQYKANHGFQNLGCHYKILGCHFYTQKGLKKTLMSTQSKKKLYFNPKNVIPRCEFAHKWQCPSDIATTDLARLMAAFGRHVIAAWSAISAFKASGVIRSSFATDATSLEKSTGSVLSPSESTGSLLSPAASIARRCLLMRKQWHL